MSSRAAAVSGAKPRLHLEVEGEQSLVSPPYIHDLAQMISFDTPP